MQACQHRRFECIQVSYRGINKCITNFNRLTTVAHIIDALLDDLCEKQNLTINDCCLYVERPPYLFPLKTTDFIQDVLLRYASANIHFKLAFKRNVSPSRFAQRKKLIRTTFHQPTTNNVYEQLKIQESLIRKQHEIIKHLKNSNSIYDDCCEYKSITSNYDNYFSWVTHQDENSDDSRISNDRFSIGTRRQSRQDQFNRKHEHCSTNGTRSLSRAQLHKSPERISNEIHTTTSSQMKSILKNKSTNARTSSIDRFKSRLISSQQRRHSVYACDDVDDGNLSDRSTTDSCLGSLSSDDNSSYIISVTQLETLV